MYDLNHIYKVGNLITKLREENGLSQSELGTKLGVTNKAVSRWENGRGYPDTAILLKLSEVLEITVDELLRGELSVSKLKHKDINENINYEAEKTLFLRFSTTGIPFFVYIMWIVLFFVDPFEWGKYLDYGEMFFIGLILPTILVTIANIILGLFFTLKIHKRKVLNPFLHKAPRYRLPLRTRQRPNLLSRIEYIRADRKICQPSNFAVQ